MTKNAKKDVVEKKPTPVAVTQAQEYDSNIGNEDLILPRVELLQALSPAVVAGDLSAGQIVNNITKVDLGNPTLVPVFLTKNWIRWRKREEGGGMMWRSADPTDERVIEESKWGADGAKPLATAYLNFLCMLEGEDLPIIVSFANTNYKTGRKWLTLTKMSMGHLSDSQYELSAHSQTNNKGTFYVFDVKKIGPATSEQKEKAQGISSMFAGKDLNFESESESTKPTTAGLGDEF
jgi:hypothetical protein